MSGFRTENERLAHGAEVFAGLSDRARSIVADLTDELGAHGDCWGTDPPGQAFAESHVDAATAVLSGMRQLPTGLGDIGTRLAATAVTYDESERAGRGTVRSAGHELA